MKVKDAMHKGAEWIDPKTPVTDIARKMHGHDIGALPAGENDKLIGMVTDRDIVCRGIGNGKDVSKLTARDVMTPAIIWCQAEEDLGEATRITENKNVRRPPVIDTNKRMAGKLNLGDVSHADKSKHASKVFQAVSSHHN